MTIWLSCLDCVMENIMAPCESCVNNRSGHE